MVHRRAAGEASKDGKSIRMTDQERPQRPQLPYDELHAAIGSDPAARSELDALRAHLDDPKPDPARVRGHVDALRGVRDVEARIANWFDDPETQRWIMTITEAGL
jgi:hypothetical protein